MLLSVCDELKYGKVFKLNFYASISICDKVIPVPSCTGGANVLCVSMFLVFQKQQLCFCL